MKKIFYLLLFISINAFSQQHWNVYRYKQFQETLTYLDSQHFKIRKLKKKFNALVQHSEIIDETRAKSKSKRHYDDFVNEWGCFIKHLKGKKKELFLKYAEEHGLDNNNNTVF